MADMDRDSLTEMVYRRLATPGFRQRLTATAPDGSRPVLVATRDELMSSILQRLAAMGGAGNVVVPHLNGLVVLAMEAEEPAGQVGKEQLTATCTVGVLVERMALTGAGTYWFQFPDGPALHSAHAEVVALAG